jgi:hypothetical protein
MSLDDLKDCILFAENNREFEGLDDFGDLDESYDDIENESENEDNVDDDIEREDHWDDWEGDSTGDSEFDRDDRSD